MRKYFNIITPYLILIVAVVFGMALWQDFSRPYKIQPSYSTPFLHNKSKWVDALVKNMSFEQKIGQLMIVEIDLSKPNMRDSLLLWIGKHYIGGVSFTKSSQKNHFDMVDRVQKKSTIPLFICSDVQENIPLPLPLPSNIAVVEKRILIKHYASLYATETKALGINLRFAPLIKAQNVDMLCENQLLGSTNAQILPRALAIFRELQNRKIIACAKYINDFLPVSNDSLNIKEAVLQNRNLQASIFPFSLLDDTEAPSAVIQKQDSMTSYEYLKNNLLYIFRISVTHGLPAVLIDNSIDLVKLNPEDKPNYIKNYLKKNINFDGLIISEPLPAYDLRTSLSQTVLAGTDIILIKENYQAIFNNVKNLMQLGLISNEELDFRVRKILLAKSWMELEQVVDADTTVFSNYLNDNQRLKTIQKIQAASVKIMRNTKKNIPLSIDDNSAITCLMIGNRYEPFYQAISAKFEVDSIYLSSITDFIATPFDKVPKKSIVIVLLDCNQPVNPDFTNWIAYNENTIVILFNNPQWLKKVENMPSIIVAGDNNPVTQQALVKLLLKSND